MLDKKKQENFWPTMERRIYSFFILYLFFLFNLFLFISFLLFTFIIIEQDYAIFFKIHI